MNSQMENEDESHAMSDSLVPSVPRLEGRHLGGVRL